MFKINLPQEIWIEIFTFLVNLYPSPFEELQLINRMFPGIIDIAHFAYFKQYSSPELKRIVIETPALQAICPPARNEGEGRTEGESNKVTVASDDIKYEYFTNKWGICCLMLKFHQNFLKFCTQQSIAQQYGGGYQQYGQQQPVAQHYGYGYQQYGQQQPVAQQHDPQQIRRQCLRMLKSFWQHSTSHAALDTKTLLHQRLRRYVMLLDYADFARYQRSNKKQRGSILRGESPKVWERALILTRECHFIGPIKNELQQLITKHSSESEISWGFAEKVTKLLNDIASPDCLDAFFVSNFGVLQQIYTLENFDRLLVQHEQIKKTLKRKNMPSRFDLDFKKTKLPVAFLILCIKAQMVINSTIPDIFWQHATTRLDRACVATKTPTQTFFETCLAYRVINKAGLLTSNSLNLLVHMLQDSLPNTTYWPIQGEDVVQWICGSSCSNNMKQRFLGQIVKALLLRDFSLLELSIFWLPSTLNNLFRNIVNEIAREYNLGRKIKLLPTTRQSLVLSKIPAYSGITEQPEQQLTNIIEVLDFRNCLRVYKNPFISRLISQLSHYNQIRMMVCMLEILFESLSSRSVEPDATKIDILFLAFGEELLQQYLISNNCLSHILKACGINEEISDITEHRILNLVKTINDPCYNCEQVIHLLHYYLRTARTTIFRIIDSEIYTDLSRELISQITRINAPHAIIPIRVTRHENKSYCAFLCINSESNKAAYIDVFNETIPQAIIDTVVDILPGLVPATIVTLPTTLAEETAHDWGVSTVAAVKQLIEHDYNPIQDTKCGYQEERMINRAILQNTSEVPFMHYAANSDGWHIGFSKRVLENAHQHSAAIDAKRNIGWHYTSMHGSLVFRAREEPHSVPEDTKSTKWLTNSFTQFAGARKVPQRNPLADFGFHSISELK